ncbi:hypothetical protein GCM10027445_63040 [Amycolatopsis endophytica]|uniref:AraC-like DNA-binding protein n=1 Tax=Amycolatopsis endophytica TaxID=860233 RepID=A0A853AYH0_9PSEU|nr:AraC family transcriptional regulator [Amycolatopsis endophytica]NYI87586.1 AraC-like DNA-binding protein [Amycolatopsis endophytica]
MHAHFERHVYHRHSHESHSFGVTETGLQGFTYRIVHLGPDLVAGVLADAAERPAGLPLFADPVLDDPGLAAALRRLHDALRTGSRLTQDEALAATVRGMVRRGSTRPQPTRGGKVPAGVHRARELLDAEYARDLSADELAAVAGRSRYALHRGFLKACGLAPSDYQRQVRLRAARRLLVTGHTPAEAAAEAGFADQSHLTRWFGRYYGVTPGVFRSA